MIIKNFDNVEESYFNYGGNAGTKLGIIYNDEYYMMKFPKNTKSMNKVSVSYTTSPLSEYIGSKIYECLDFKTHETYLGIYDQKLVVICKDFKYEQRKLHNTFETFGDIINQYSYVNFENYVDSGNLDLENCINIIKNSSTFKKVGEKNALEHFWDMFVVDTLINNNDRNNGNWGVLRNIYDPNIFNISPIFDNGNSFNNKLTDEKMLNSMKNINENVINGTQSAYRVNNKNINCYNFLKTHTYVELDNSLLKIVPKINLEKINQIIDSIPAVFDGVTIISENQKVFMKASIQARYENLLLPALENIKKRSIINIQ